METMIKLKKAIKDKEGDTIGYEIVEATEFLVDQQLNKPKDKRSKPWKHVEIATEADIKQYGTEFQKSEKKESISLKFDESQMNEIKKIADDATQYAESALKETEETKKENAELKKQLAEFKKAQETKDKKEPKKD